MFALAHQSPARLLYCPPTIFEIILLNSWNSSAAHANRSPAATTRARARQSPTSRPRLPRAHVRVTAPSPRPLARAPVSPVPVPRGPCGQRRLRQRPGRKPERTAAHISPQPEPDRQPDRQGRTAGPLWQAARQGPLGTDRRRVFPLTARGPPGPRADQGSRAPSRAPPRAPPGIRPGGAHRRQKSAHRRQKVPGPGSRRRRPGGVSLPGPNPSQIPGRRLPSFPARHPGVSQTRKFRISRGVRKFRISTAAAANPPQIGGGGGCGATAAVRGAPEENPCGAAAARRGPHRSATSRRRNGSGSPARLKYIYIYVYIILKYEKRAFDIEI